MKRIVFFSVLAACLLLSAYGMSIKNKEATAKPQDPEFFFALSNSDDRFYQATSFKEDNITKWYITEQVHTEIGQSTSKTCTPEYDTKKSEPGARSIKAWGNRKLLLVELVDSTLWVHHLDFDNCAYKLEPIHNVDEFQVYVTSDSEFDILWTSDSPKLKDFIMINAYTVGGVQSEKRNFVRKPESKDWEVLLLGKAAYFRETRKNLENVVSQINSEHNVTDLMKIGSYKSAQSKYLISNLHDELGVCVVIFNKYFICRKYDRGAVSKLNFTMISDDLKHQASSEFESNLVMHNLADGGMVILFIESAAVGNDAETQLIRGFTPVVVRPDGSYSNSVKSEFDDAKFKCSTKVDARGTSQVSIVTNVIDQKNSYCFQFICPESKKNPLLNFKKKCLVKESMGGESSPTTTPKPKPNGVEEFSAASVWILSAVSMFLVKLMN